MAFGTSPILRGPPVLTGGAEGESASIRRRSWASFSSSSAVSGFENAPSRCIAPEPPPLTRRFFELGAGRRMGLGLGTWRSRWEQASKPFRWPGSKELRDSRVVLGVRLVKVGGSEA
jgi:hypothetical protein